MASEYNNNNEKDKRRRQSYDSYKDSKRIADKMTRLSVPSIKTSIHKAKNGDKSSEVAFPNVKKLIRRYDSIDEKKKSSPKSSDNETSFDFRELRVNVENIKDRLDSTSKNSEDDDNSISSTEYKNPSPKKRRIRGRTKSLKEYFSSQSLMTRGVNVFSFVDLPKHFDGVLEDKYRSSQSSKRFEVRSYSDSNIGRKGSVVPILPRLDSGTSDMSLEGTPVTFDSWSDSTTSAKNLKRRASATPLSLSPAVSTPSGSIENFRLTKSASCGVLSFPSDGEWKRSNSSDSAVVVEDECKYIDDSRGSVTPSGASVRRNSHYRKESPFLSNDFWNSGFAQSTPLDSGSQRYCDSEDYTEKDEYNIVLRRSSTRTQRNPSVVISDHSGHSVSVHVAYASEDFSLDNLGSTPDLLQDDYCFPRRKASDCSLCSTFGPGDMEYCICYGSAETGSENIISQRRLSDCSTCSYLTASEDEVEVSLEEPTVLRENSNWRKVRNVVQWSPFIQTYKRHKYPWVQLAGHQGNFKAGNKQGTIMKKLCKAEEVAFEEIQKDFLRPFVPEYLGIVDGSDGEKYLQLQDLLSDFSSACVMDIKMGVRTYLEEELAKARHKPKLRKDMYDKMIQIDANAPSEAENRAKAVTKPRYMVWRETISSTATLGFRIEGIRRGDGTSSKDFKTTRTRDQVMTAIAGFIDGYPNAVINYINRLKEIRATLEKSKFFKSHELIGSSLLFVHNEEKSSVWLIDFAKTVPLPDLVNITHREPWVEGTHEDGYLIGLDNLINLMENLHKKLPVLKPNDSEICNPQVQGPIPDQILNSTLGNTEGHHQVLPDITEEKRGSEPEVILSNNIKEKGTNEEDRKISAKAEDLHIPVKKISKNVTNVIERKVLDETRN